LEKQTRLDGTYRQPEPERGELGISVNMLAIFCDEKPLLAAVGVF
jgi:hypothetical protein